MEEKKSNRRCQIGRVVGDKAEKTVKVMIEGIVKHSRYKKYIKKHSTFLVHDPEEKCRVGDLVRIEECRPISKLKKWVIRDVIKHGTGALSNVEKENADDTAGNDA